MSLFRDVDTRFRWLDIKVMVFAGLGVLAAGALLLTLAFQQGYFATKIELLTEAPTGTDLRPGMAIKLSGFKIGEVRRVTLNKNARVDLHLRIEEQYMPWIKADSVVSTAREGLIGDSYLTVTSGSPNFSSLKNGESIIFMPSPALADIAQDVRNRILPVIDGTTALLGYLNDPQGDLRSSIGDLRKLVGEMRQTSTRTLANADRALATVEKTLPEISARTDAALNQLDVATAAAQQTAKATTQAIESAVPKLNRLLDNTDAAVSKSRVLMDGAGRRWPFKGGRMPEDVGPDTEPGKAVGNPP